MNSALKGNKEEIVVKDQRYLLYKIGDNVHCYVAKTRSTIKTMGLSQSVRIGWIGNSKLK